MKLKRIALGVLAALVVAGTAGWFSLDKETRGLLATVPTNRDLLFWNLAQRDAAFRALDRIPLLAKSRVVPAGGTPMPLPPGPPLKLAVDIDGYMASQRTAALVVLQDGKVRLERYGLGFDRDGRWTSFSVAKSMTSTLVGAAIRDGHIKSMDDKVSTYLPQMKGSAYDDVSIRQLLTMTSGVQWNEDYSDPNSDVARFNNHKPEPGVDALVSYLRRLPRAAPAGTRWNYSTGETNLVGLLLAQATKKPLSAYLSEKIWVPAGMEQQATWILNKSGQEISGCCIQATTRDFARFGWFVLDGARVGGQPIVPEGWLAEATTERAPIGQPGRGYGYQWWTYADGTFAARGIFGQGLFIDPKRRLVIASNGNGRAAPATAWPAAHARSSTARCRRRWTRSAARPLSRASASQGLPLRDAVAGQRGDPVRLGRVEGQPEAGTHEEAGALERLRVLAADERRQRIERHRHVAERDHLRLQGDFLQPPAALEAVHHVAVIQLVQADAVALRPPGLAARAHDVLGRRRERRGVHLHVRLQLHRAGTWPLPRRAREPSAALRSRRWNVGHSAWLGAGQAAACRRPLLTAFRRFTMASISSALAASIRRSMFADPSGENIERMSSSEKPAAWPSATSASWSSTPGAKRRRSPCRPTDAISPFSS